VGFAFEHYDAIGAWQDSEVHTDSTGMVHSLPVDASGDLPTTDVAGPLYGAVELSQQVADSTHARYCFSQNWYRSALGQAWNEDNRCTPFFAQEKLEQTDSFEAFLLDLVTSDAFLYVESTDANAAQGGGE